MRARSLAWLLAAAVVLLMAAPAAAQPGLKGDVALSYAALYDKELPNNVFGINGFMPAGWLVSGSWHLIDSVSVVGEVGGSYKPISFMGTDVTLNVYNYMGGLRLSGPGVPLVSPFAQVLVGTARVSASASGTTAATNGFAAQVGAGADVTVFPKIAVRVQGDYRYIRADGGNGNEFRLAVGVVYRFGLL
jgi:opacity protein-like surface antigen